MLEMTEISAAVNESTPQSKSKFTNIRALLILVAIIVGLSIYVAVKTAKLNSAAQSTQINDKKEYAGHWMEGPAIAILLIFMPLTAVSYLHFRLPKKKDEFAALKTLLCTDKINAHSLLISGDEQGDDYLLPIFFVSFFSFLGFYILFANNALVLFNGADWIAAVKTSSGINTTDDINNLDFSNTEGYRRGVVSIGMAFLGAYIWSLQYVFRRMMTLDLPPGAYYSIGGRMVYSAFVALVLQHFLYSFSSAESSEYNEMLNRQIMTVSFFVGIFPDRALAWMKDGLGRIFAEKSDAAASLPLEMLEGISGFHKARLGDLGIDNVQNLAQSSLMELILKTPFEPRVIIDWMAQARLCLEFKDKTKYIRGAGVRTIFDLQEIAEDETLLKQLAINAELEESYIRTVCKANEDEDSIKNLRDAYNKLNVI
jgi:hypothetical protein